MNHSLIDHLLQKYWDAETSVEEESQLKEYFNGSQIHESHVAFAPLFQYQVTFEKIDSPLIFSEEALISKLLDRYWNAETNTDEESLLRSYFNGGNVASSLKDYQPIFLLQNQIRNIESPKRSEVRSSGKNPKIISLRLIRAVAATAVLALAALFLLKNNLTQDKKALPSNYVEIDDPQEAYEYTMAALAKVSRNYNKGKLELEVGMNNMNQVNIFKQQ